MATSPFAAPLLGSPVAALYDNAGNPLSGGLVETYVAGTSTPYPTYPTYPDAIAGTNPNTNPVVLDAAGRAPIWGQAVAYKIIVKDSGGATIWTADNYYPANGYPPTPANGWVRLGDLTPASFTYVNGTQFTVNGVDVTATFAPGRRVLTTSPGSPVYSTVVSSAFGPNTTVTLANDSGAVLNPAMSDVFYGALAYNNPAYLDPGTAFTAYLTADQSSFAAATKLAGWTVEQDPLSEWNAGNNRLLLRYPGRYLVQAQVEYRDTGTNVDVTLYIDRNGGHAARSNTRTSPTASQVWTVSCQTIVTVTNTSSYVELFFAGTANSTVVGNIGTRFTVTRLSRAG